MTDEQDLCLACSGRHLYLSGQVQAAKLAGLDIKAGNGFVVAPPSRRMDGGLYAWA